MASEEPAVDQNKDQEANDEPKQILALALRDLANDPGVSKAVSEVIQHCSKLIIAAADRKASQPKAALRSMIFSLGFGILIFVGIGVMGYLKIMNGEATTGLLGILIGYWYGKQQKS
jgi:hypothetical protein